MSFFYFGHVHFLFFSDMSIFIYEMIIILVIKIVMNAVTTIS